MHKIEVHFLSTSWFKVLKIPQEFNITSLFQCRFLCQHVQLCTTWLDITMKSSSF